MATEDKTRKQVIIHASGNFLKLFHSAPQNKPVTVAEKTKTH
jgi:hypothetical protein